jgi:hypothetical protein
MAQQSKTEPATQTQKRGSKITFPPNAFAKSSAKAKVIGTTSEGLVMETNAGQKILIKKDNTVEILKSNEIWPPCKTCPEDLTLIGTAENGNAVWEGPDGKSCTLDIKTGKANAYAAKVEKFTIPKPRGN